MRHRCHESPAEAVRRLLRAHHVVQVAADCVQRTGVFGKVAELQGMGVLQEMSEVVVAIP